MNPVLLPHPFNFYKLLLDSDAMHFGYWTQASLSLEQAQEALTQLLLMRFPKPPAKVLDIGCGLGATSGLLAKQGFEVTALAPSAELIAYAEQHNSGANYLNCGFMDAHPALQAPARYDVILLQESLQYLPDLPEVFSKIKSLLKPETGRVVFCDEVSYDASTQAHSAVHSAVAIEQAFFELGFYVTYHLPIGAQVLPTCEESCQRFTQRHDALAAQCGAEAQDLLAHYTEGWRYQDRMYRAGSMGYEVWELRLSDFSVRGYRDGDELVILPTFNQVFGAARTLAHWRWKYLDNPFGQTFIGSVWQGAQLIAQYAGYPVPLWFNNQLQMTCQGADVFTLPAYRGVGRGKTNLFSRAFRYFSRRYYEHKIPFAYGFNTGIPQKLGKLFMDHHFPAQVYEWNLSAQQVRHVQPLRNKLKGISIVYTEQVGAWADEIFEQAAPQYGAMVARTQSYLRWRYQQHPDTKFSFFVVSIWGKPVGWLAGKLSSERFLLGDALFIQNKQTFAALEAGLNGICRHFPYIETIQAWFSYTPAWWVSLLEQVGFSATRQAQNLDFGLHLVDKSLDAEELGKQFYFTWGDSDLY